MNLNVSLFDKRDPELQQEISFMEMQAAINKSKIEKAPGPHSISTEFYKNSG